MAERFPRRLEDVSVSKIIASDLLAMHQGDPPFEYANDQGQLYSVYASMPYTPHILPNAFNLMKSIYTPATLPARTRQMGIFAVAAIYDNPYVKYCHRLIAPKLAFSTPQIDDAMQGNTPRGITSEEAVAYATALKLARDRQPLDDESFETARLVLGREGVAGLANVVAGYVYVCILANVSGSAAGGWTVDSEQDKV